MVYPISKRVFDACVTLALLLLLAPLIGLAFAILGLNMLVSRRDRGPWLYRERRISAGREFDVLKFRVLRMDVQRAIPHGEYARLYERDQGNLTWAGKALKSMYLDELPQLVNVLRGDMSLVGPRPWPLAMVQQQREQGYDYRDRVVAGCTGLAQVQKDQPKGRGRALALDLVYVEALATTSGPKLVWQDVKILAESLRTIGRGRGLRY